MRTEKNVNKGIISWSNTKFRDQHHKKCVAWRKVMRITDEILGVKGLKGTMSLLLHLWDLNYCWA